jgi:hypothetical protein
MALTAAEVLTRAADIIQDQTNVRWPQAELLRYLNDARREVAIARPDLYATTTNVSLAAGTKQSLPSDGMRLIDVTRNMPGGSPAGALRVVEREILDAQRPDWHTETQTAALKHFMYDERSPRVFYVYPPAVAGHQIEVIYGRSPADITNVSTQLTDEDIYAGAIVDYVCYRAFSKDSEYAGNGQRAIAHYQQFLNALGLGGKMGRMVSPNVANIGGIPPRGE